MNPRRSRAALVPVLAVVLAVVLAGVGAGVGAAQSSRRSTLDGVFTEAQATEGKNLFAMACQNCHTLAAHSGPPFRNRFFGKTLGDLFEYLQSEMPKADPGSLSDDEYLVAVAYLMKINGMPSGSTPLAADVATLHRIRIDSVRPAPSSTGPRR